MPIIFGTRWMGKVDAVSGVGHVATRFFHVQFLPLIPVESYLIFREVGEQVWSAMFGYPGDGEYREFHKKDAVHGFQYWRVTEGKPDLAYKQPYDPYRAGQRVREHASHFSWLVGNQLKWS